MNVFELRLGNFVQDAKFPNIPSEIVGIKPDCIETNYSDFEEINMELITPIPLTEEWLLKLGFKKCNIRPKGNYTYEKDYDLDGVDLCGFVPYLLNDIIIGFYPLEKKFYLVFEQFGSDEGSYLFKEILWDIKFVHQMQNIYFTIIKKDLKLIL